MNHRKFKLINAKGDIWDLTDPLICSFLSEPEGLGFNQTLTTVQYGNSLRVATSETNFPSVSGDVLFYDSSTADKYFLYASFVDFCTITPLYLVYSKPCDNVEYRLKCEVATLNKTEVKEDHMMTCPITFQGLGMWEGEEIVINGTDDVYSLVNNGHFPVGFEIKVEGALENPYFTLEQDGEVYGEAKFDDSTSFDSVYVNSNDGEQNVILEQSGSVLPNPLSYQDLSISNGSIYVTFVKLAKGESTLTIGMDSGSITNVEIRMMPKYRSV